MSTVATAQSGPGDPLATEKTQPSAAVTGFQERNPRYALRKGDSFDVDFAFSTEFNQTVVVQPDGFITLRGAGDARGRSDDSQLTETIRLHQELGQVVALVQENRVSTYREILRNAAIWCAIGDQFPVKLCTSSVSAALAGAWH